MLAKHLFQVTKRGDSVIGLLRCEVRRPIRMGVKDGEGEWVEEAGVEVVVEGASEEEDVLLGVEVPVLGAVRRETAGFFSLGLVGFEEASCSDASEDSASSASTSCSERASPSASSRPLG